MDEIIATLQNLASALGARDPTEPGNPYVLGDDGLGCLRDIKRWLQHYDEKRDVWDVKAALGSMNLVGTDICPILASWSRDQVGDDHKRRICLACVEILVPLTWPLEVGPETDEIKFRQLPGLKLAQAAYKRSILFDPEHDILTSIISVALPSLALARQARSERDTGIIRLVLYLLRNLVAIDGDRQRSDTILSFQKANALDFLCVLASGIGEDFLSEDVIVLDVLYNLLRGVDTSNLFGVKRGASENVKTELNDLLEREKCMKTNNRKQAHTRHNRFGTMVSVVQDTRRFTVASQTAIISNLAGNNFSGIEASKKWNKPQRKIRSEEDVERKIVLNMEARLALGTFTAVFLDAAFNPMFTSLLRALENDDSKVSQANRLQFLYLQGWFFRALRERGQALYRSESRGVDFRDDADYQLIASMMESRATIMLRKMLREAVESKLWQETHAAMDCFKELLLTIDAMSLSSDPEYQEIAENLQSNLYYEEANLDLIAACVRTYSNQSFGYLNACTDLATVLLKMLEKFASTRTHMFVRARRQRQQKKRQAAKESQVAPQSDDETAESNVREAVKERAFSFAKFELKFMNDHAVDTFITLLEFYADLNAEQIKRAIGFLHRVFVKQKIELLIYRLEIFELLSRMLSDSTGLSRTNAARSEVEAFTTFMFKRFTRTLETCPALAWEILFEKLSNDPYYLTHEKDKAPAPRKIPRAPAELEMRPGMTDEEQIRVIVALLLDEDRSTFLNWLIGRLESILSHRRAWENRISSQLQTDGDRDSLAIRKQAAEELVPEDNDMKMLIYKNGKIRLLLSLAGLVRIGAREDPEALWVIPEGRENDELARIVQFIKQYVFEPPTFEDKPALSYVRRKTRRRESYNTDGSSGSSDSSSEGSQGQKPQKKRLSKHVRRKKEITEIDYDVLEARRLKREEMEAQRKSQIKSSKYVHDSDDEVDEAANAIFFAAEAALRERQKLKARNVVATEPNPQKPQRMRKTSMVKEIHSDSASAVESSDKENRMLPQVDSSDSDASKGASVVNDLSHRAFSRKRVLSGAPRHGNALFVQDSSEEEEDDYRADSSRRVVPVQEDPTSKRSKTTAEHIRNRRQIVESSDGE